MSISLLGLGTGVASASTVSTNPGTLLIQGDNDADAIVLSSDGTTLRITDTGPGGVVDSSAFCTQANPITVTCPVTPPGQPRFGFFFSTLGDGVDSFANLNFNAQGQVFNFGATGAKSINGGPGPQFLSGGEASDVIDGGEGDDDLNDGGGQIESPTGGNDTLIGGPGEDSTDYGRDATAPMSLTLDGNANDGQAGETDNIQVENVIGGRGDDVIAGDAASNSLVGNTGSDTITGLGGNDQLFGDFGPGGGAAARAVAGPPTTNDVLDGGAGRDGYNCGGGVDLALHDSTDQLSIDCERIGAGVDAESAGLSGKKNNKAKIGIACPDTEGAACTGKLTLSASGKTIGKGKFSVAAGATAGAKAKLKKQGLKAVSNAGGSLFVTVSVLTDEPGGVSESTGRILLFQ